MKAILVIGSNYGSRANNLMTALKHIETTCFIISASTIYESPDCLGSGNKYLNMVLAVDTNLSESQLNERLKDIEKRCGRNQLDRNRGEVLIDIDLVVWNEELRRKKDFEAYYFQKGFSMLKDIRYPYEATKS